MDKLEILPCFEKILTSDRIKEIKNTICESENYNFYKKFVDSHNLYSEIFAQLDIFYKEKDYYYESKVHGISHSERVTFLALVFSKLIDMDSHSKKILLTAARYHDIGRINDCIDNKHGLKSVEKIKELGLLNDFMPEDIELINFIIEQHSLSSKENLEALQKISSDKRDRYQKFLYYLKDMDALDRCRISNEEYRLDPNRLRNDVARQMVDFALENYKYFDEIIIKSYKLNREKTDTNKNESIFRNEKNKQRYQLILDSGYNISYDIFLELLEMLQGNLSEIEFEEKINNLEKKGMLIKLFSKEFYDSCHNNDEQDFRLFERLNKKIKISMEDYVQNYLLYKELENLEEKTHVLSALLMYYNGGFDIKKMFGIIKAIDYPKDLQKLADYGYYFNIYDIIQLFSDIEPDNFRQIMDSNRIDDLFCYNSSTDLEAFNKNILKRLKFCFSYPIYEIKNDIQSDYVDFFKLYNYVLNNCPNLFNKDIIKKYNIQEIYLAISRLKYVKYKIEEMQNGQFQFTDDDVINLLEFSEETNFLKDFDYEQSVDILKMKEKKFDNLHHPSVIKYITKKNKVFFANNIRDVFNYNAFCMRKILQEDTTYEKACSNLIKSFFEIDFNEYSRFGSFEYEKNIIDELYFFNKYVDEGKIQLSKDEQIIKDIVLILIKLFDGIPTIENFKDSLSECFYSLQNVDFENLYNTIRKKMNAFSKNDIVEKLKESEKNICELCNTSYIYNDDEYKIKVLDGQDYSIATYFVAPATSMVIRGIIRFFEDEKKFEDYLLYRSLSTNNKCVTLSNHDVNTALKSCFEYFHVTGCNLCYGYVPNDITQISIRGLTDLSTIKFIYYDTKTIERLNTRPTQNRSFDDLVYGTIEQHNETVLNNVLPRYIVCYDSIEPLALEKYKVLKEAYRANGIEQDLDIILIKEENYLKKNDEELITNLNKIIEILDKSSYLDDELMQLFFKKRERNITVQTIQSVNSFSYSTECFDRYFENNKKKFDKLIIILTNVASKCDEKYLGDILYQVQMLINMNEGNYYLSTNTIAYSKKGLINLKQIYQIKEIIDKRLNLISCKKQR